MGLTWVWGTVYPCLHQTEVPVVSDNWICWSWFLDEQWVFFFKPSN